MRKIILVILSICLIPLMACGQAGDPMPPLVVESIATDHYNYENGTAVTFGGGSGNSTSYAVFNGTTDGLVPAPPSTSGTTVLLDNATWGSIPSSSGGLPDDFANDPATTSGLTYGYKAGTISFFSKALDSPSRKFIDAGTIELAPSSDNYIYIDNYGNVGSSTDNFPIRNNNEFSASDFYALAVVTTNETDITEIDDNETLRTSVNIPNDIVLGSELYTDNKIQTHLLPYSLGLSNFNLNGPFDIGGNIMRISISWGELLYLDSTGTHYITMNYSDDIDIDVTGASTIYVYVNLATQLVEYNNTGFVLPFSIYPLFTIYTDSYPDFSYDDNRGMHLIPDLPVRGSDTLPTPDITWRGKIYTVYGGTGVADTSYICQKDATDNYVWVVIP